MTQTPKGVLRPEFIIIFYYSRIYYRINPL